MKDPINNNSVSVFAHSEKGSREWGSFNAVKHDKVSFTGTRSPRQVPIQQKQAKSGQRETVHINYPRLRPTS